MANTSEICDMKDKAKIMCADGSSKRAGSYHKYLKEQKNRIERRRAKKDPECTPGYGKYRGYET